MALTGRSEEAAPAAAEQGPAAGVLEPLAALEALGAGRLPPELLAEMAALRERARQRLAHSRDHVVVAVAGGTGSGKSALVNALLGQAVSRPGVRRPTTDHAQAAPVGDAAGVDPLLDWLQVYERHPVPAEGAAAGLQGALLLDLPDVDSVVRAHWDTAERLIERCDLLLWVVDPVKYAHAVAHEGYFTRLAHHADVLLVALNHADRLGEDDRQVCLAHLRELLAEHGLGQARCLLTSAATGEGVAEVSRQIAAEVRERRAPLARIRADVAALVARSAAQLPPPKALALDVDALAGIQRRAVNEAELRGGAGRAYRRGAEWATGSPLRRLLGPALARLRRRKADEGAGQAEVPRPAVAEPQVRQGLLGAVAPAADRLPEPAAERLRRLAASAAAPLAEDLRQRLAGLAIEPAPRLWWDGVGTLRAAVEMAAGLGLGWLLGRGVADWLTLPPVPAPALIGEVTWPLALLVGGGLGSAALGAAARPLIALGARRHSRALQRAVYQEAGATGGEPLAELHQELSRCRELSEQARRAAASDPAHSSSG